MEHSEPDYGTGHKKLSVYVFGVFMCVLLTLVAFGSVMFDLFEKWEMITIVFTTALLQLIIQLVCFLRLNIQTMQGRANVISLLFTGLVLACIILGSLWIMFNLDYNMMH